MNVLHLHASDMCRFGVESKLFPELTESLAGIKKGHYTQDDIKELIAFARDRGVRILPEFDMPGHGAWGKSHPELMAAPTAIEFDPTNEALYPFLKKFLEEMEEKEQLSAMRVETASLAAFQTGGRGSGKGNFRGGAGAFAARGYPPGGLGRGFGKGAQGGIKPPNQPGLKEKKIFCWSCWDKDKGRSVYNSHNMGEKTCPTGSHLGNVAAEDEGEVTNDQQPQPWELGYDDDNQDANLVPALQQVKEQEMASNALYVIITHHGSGLRSRHSRHLNVPSIL